jgi:pimeloyl-ACP methyl ester carboxylesterase
MEKELSLYRSKVSGYCSGSAGIWLKPVTRKTVSLSWSVGFLKDFLGSLKLAKSNIIGHSLGGMLSLVFASRYPELIDRLVAVDPCGLGKFARKGRLILAVLRRLDRWQGKKRGPKYLGVPLVEEWQILDDLPEIKTPVLIVWGKKDIYLPISHSRIAQILIRIPGFTFSLNAVMPLKENVQPNSIVSLWSSWLEKSAAVNRKRFLWVSIYLLRVCAEDIII